MLKERLYIALSPVSLVREYKMSSNPNRNSNKVNGSGGKFNWKDAIADATIIGALHFFSTLSSVKTALSQVDWKNTLITATVSFFLGFFATLAIKRGLLSRYSSL